ncbi:transmembrane sensor domain protein [Leptolyngbya sp. Heron Island J]|uniref:sensor histidine kinase n=1 Tax=Leptolyngbya sp. Heron Island J TaxID=1385935 RepID=UPI0003B97A70|nr:CHASE2 domain-containing protein [Leptolyngbya sp. Heron Island J]ESA34993.1 transmembrane sensor domain protein [Leptolyngbya sp. Heron Island J]
MGIFKDRRLNFHSGEFSGLSIIAIIVALRMLGFLQALEWNLLDFALRKRPAEPTDDKVTIVYITEADIQTSLSYPISDQSLADLLKQVQTYEPRVIGLDIFRDFPVGEGYNELANVLTSSDNIVGIKKITTPTISPPQALPPEQVGFVDVPLDQDGFLRRSLLGVTDQQGNYQFSFTIRLAAKYLADEGFNLDNGRRDPATMRFGDAEVPRFRANTGGYVRADDAGNQTLINFRAGATPFTKVTYGELVSGAVPAALLQDRVVLIGYDAISAKDFVNVAALAGENPGLVPGVAVQAHAVSQLINATLNNRAFLSTPPIWIEYGLLIVGGVAGLVLASSCLKPSTHLLIVAAVSIGLGVVFYALLLTNWWLPMVPVMVLFGLNAMVLYPMYQAQAQLRSQLNQRQQLIDWTFSTIHNGPLQTLARFLKEWPTDSDNPNFNKADLKQLNQELRALYDAMRQEMLMPGQQLVLNQRQIINLEIPLTELLYEIYSNTTKRRKDFFENLLHITEFQEIDDSHLPPDQKRELSRFLEEALLNVCKYAPETTRLHVVCQPEGTDNVIRVIDNGANGLFNPEHEGYGTHQAKQLAQTLGGVFERYAVSPKGVRCELRWPITSQQQQRWCWFNRLKFWAGVPGISTIFKNNKLES